MADGSDNRQTECTPKKCFIYEYENHITAKCPKPPTDKEKRRNKIHFNEKDNRACDNSESNSDQKINSSMAHMSGNDEYHSETFGDSLQLTN